MEIKCVKVNYVGTYDYTEYILTGIFNDARKKNYQFKYKKAKYCSELRIFIFKVMRKILSLTNPINVFLSKKYHLGKFTITYEDGSKKVVVLDSDDTPWTFFEDELQKCDVYYKFQCPIDYEKGYYRLNENNIFEFTDTVKKYLYKIKPLFEPRPLGRKMDFEENNRILNAILERKSDSTIQRQNSLLVYLGNCTDIFKIENIDHPHKKRIMVMSELNKLERRDIRIIFRGKGVEINSYDSSWDQYYEGLPVYKKSISYSDYLDMCFSSKATLNIAGLRGSIPFRFMDAFLSNMIILTDTPTVKWYVPFEEINQIIDIGKMGYEILSEEQFNDRIKSILEYVSTIDEIRSDMFFEYYEKYFSPEVILNKIYMDLMSVN